MDPTAGKRAASGQTFGHYRLIEPIGAGGMGEVWRAQDERLERDVALKVLLPGTLASEAARKHFRKEALVLSRLNHPNIATVFDFDTHDGLDFEVMEYVPGESLDALIARGPLDEETIAALALQVAEALEASHEMNIIHCDLKPGNIRVTPKRRVKVLDFGLARILHREAGWVSTTDAADPSVLAGTLPYMAPEQIRGEQADVRTDLNALGVVLYELATGRRPFVAAQPVALMYAIVNSAPEAPRRLRPEISPGLEALILRAIEKSPDHRYQSAREMAADLRRIGPPTSAATEAPVSGGPAARGEAPVARTASRGIESLAVLPLKNLSGDPAQEFFADGMTEALIATLAQISALRVISRTSAMQYKDASQPLPEIARALRVDAVVEGSAVRAGNRVRITAQLIEAASDRHLWAGSYERDAGDILALQGEVARAIAEEVRIHLTPGERARLAGHRSVDPRTYELYLRGRHYWNKRNIPDVRRAIELFNLAIEADPTWGAAYAGLADSYNILGDQHALAPLEAAKYARAATERALDLDPQLADAHSSMGFIRMFYDWDWAGAERAHAQAVALNPSYATGRQWYAEHLASQGRFDEAIAQARRAHELDPLSFIIGTTLGDTFYFSRRYDEAIAALRAIVEVEPGFLHAVRDLGRAYTERGSFEEAFACFDDTSRRSGGDARASAGLGRAYALAGREREARDVLAELELWAHEAFVSPFSIATIHAALDDIDPAFAHLDRAFTMRDTSLVWIKVHPRVDPLRTDPRFPELLRRLGHAA